MKSTIAIAALILSGAVLVGCDNSSSTPTPPAMPAGSTATTPAMPAAPDTTKMSNGINSAIDKGADAMKTQADKMSANAPTTMPSMPAMPK